jgi:hypothetical protein
LDGSAALFLFCFFHFSFIFFYFILFYVIFLLYVQAALFAIDKLEKGVGLKEPVVRLFQPAGQY